MYMHLYFTTSGRQSAIKKKRENLTIINSSNELVINVEHMLETQCYCHSLENDVIRLLTMSAQIMELVCIFVRLVLYELRTQAK